MNYTYREVDPKELKLGGEFKYVYYDWRPYKKRSPEARADYNRLEQNLIATGHMVNPLIVYRGCVLIGMRRCEIAIKLGWTTVPIWDIQTDIYEDRTPDRVFKLRDKYKKVEI